MAADGAGGRLLYLLYLHGLIADLSGVCKLCIFLDINTDVTLSFILFFVNVYSSTSRTRNY